jgi:hypothetical protein
LLPGIDDVGIDLMVRGRGAHAEQAVFGMDENVVIGRDEARHQRGYADAKVHELARSNVPRRARGDPFSRQSCHNGAPVLINRSTKMQGVTISVGDSTPTSTIVLTSTTVSAAAVAMAGAKLRAR